MIFYCHKPIFIYWITNEVEIWQRKKLDSFNRQKAQLSLTNRTMLFCKVVEVLQDILSENEDKKFTTKVPNYYSAFDTIILLLFYS